MKRHLTRALRLTITVIIVAMLVVFATKVNWHSTWAAIQDASISILLLAALVIFVSRAAHITSAKVLATLALERLFELIGYVILLALAVSLLPLPAAIERTRPFAWLALALIAGFLIYLLRRPESPDQVI